MLWIIQEFIREINLPVLLIFYNININIQYKESNNNSSVEVKTKSMC